VRSTGNEYGPTRSARGEEGGEISHRRAIHEKPCVVRTEQISGVTLCPCEASPRLVEVVETTRL
jgi:hypothetical protein